MDLPVLVVGAGPAGLAVAASLRRRGVEALVVDRGSAVGDSWRTRYDRLHLHTPQVQSGLPGLPVPKRFGRWVARDDMVRYLGDYAAHHRIEPRFGTTVRRLDRDARHVVFASGFNCEPVLPPWPGADSFPADLMHASAYANPERFRGKDVLVVGAGNTDAEIAADLAEGGAASVRLAVRTPPNVIPRQLGPVPSRCWASRSTTPPPGCRTRSTGCCSGASSGTSRPTACPPRLRESSRSSGPPASRRRSTSRSSHSSRPAG